MKNCAKCGVEMRKQINYSKKQWEARLFCSQRCGRLGKKASTETIVRLKIAHIGKTGAKASGWRGGVAVCGRYRRIYMPEHANANQKGYAYEHRVVAERLIGRSLREKEVVHHWDNNGFNNEPANLVVLRNEAAHRRLHAFAKRHGIPVLLLRFKNLCV